MTNVTDVFENFRRVLTDISRRHLLVDKSWDSDEWDDLSECLYEVFVVSPIKHLHSSTIARCYENWNLESFEFEIICCFQRSTRILQPSSNEFLLLENAECESESLPFHFTFVEFNHPFIEEGDLSRFDYVSGFSDQNQKVCTAVENCSFFVHRNE